MELFSNILGEGEPLIIMHGVFGMGDNWQTLGRRWADEYEVHLLDMRNHGRSPHSDEFSYDVMSDDLLEYMDKHDMEKARIIGHSMGGKVAMLFAALNPERTEKLLVADISPRAYKPHHDEILKALKGLDLDNLDSRSDAQEQFAIKDPGIRQFLLKSLYWNDEKKLAWRFNVNVIAREIEKVTEGLPDQAIYHGPTLFVRGGRSNYIEEEDFELIHNHFPEAKVATVEGAGHWLHAEKPDAFYDTASEFLAD